MPIPGKRPTIRDVAAEAGVAPMTASYSFSQPSRVAHATRQRVFEAASRLGYSRPNATAQALRSGRTNQLGVILGEHLSYAFDDPQAASFLGGVSEVCVEKGLGMVLIPTSGAESDVERVRAAAVDSFVLWTTTDDDPVLEAVVASGRPAAIQGGPEFAGITCISQDARSAAAAVVAAALNPDAVPVVISFPLDRERHPHVGRAGDLPTVIRFPVTSNRLMGYRDAIDEAGKSWADTPLAVVERNDRAHGAIAMTALLREIPDAPLTVISMSDELALGALDALTTAGRAATVTGWDGSKSAQARGIISVTNPLREQGRACARASLEPDSRFGPVEWRIVTP